MRHLRALLVITTLALAACSGGGSGSSPTTIPNTTPPPTGQPTAVQSISFRIPASLLTHTTPTSTVRALKSFATRKPLYVSPDTAAFSLYIDGQAALKNIPANAAGSASAQPISGLTGTAGYTITQQTNNGQTYYLVTATTDLLPGQHAIGVVLTAADGFVLSEDQETLALNGGSNQPATFSLRGVVDSAFWCDAACDGGAGTPAADGTYTLQVFATDHEGDAIAYQTDAKGNAVQLDNGPVTLVETDGKNTVTIGNAGPFGNPGNAFTVSYLEGGNTILEGYNVTLKCNALGTATVAVKVGSGPLNGGVTGFNYSALIDPSKDPVNPNAPVFNPFPTPQTAVYTTAGLLVGTVPVTQDFGNQLTLNCDATLNLSFQ